MQHHSSDRRNLMTQYCFDNCSDTEFIISHFINWLDCSSGCSVCLSVFLSSLLHCRIQQQEGSLLRKEKQRNAPASASVFPLGCTIWQNKRGAGRASERYQVCSNMAGRRKRIGACVSSPLSRFPFTLWVCFKCVLQTLFA